MNSALVLVVTTLYILGVSAGPTCPKRDGKDPVYIPHEDCTKFWECSNGTPYLFNCSANLHFNPTLNVCDWPDQAGCVGNGGSGGGSSSSSESNGSQEDPVVTAPPAPPAEDSGSGGKNSNENNGGNGGCPAKDGEYPVYIPHEDCTKFWQCSNGVPYLFNCSANLHFNPVLNVCDWPDQAGCVGNGGSGSGSSSSSESNGSGSSSSSESNGSQDDPVVTAPPAPPAEDSGSGGKNSNENNGGNGGCPARDGEYPVYIPHEDCTKFWQCSNGTPYLFDCPANLHFNPKLNVCDWPLDAGCKGNAGNSSGGSSSGSKEN